MTKRPVQKGNTQNNTKTRRTPRRNRHLERTIFVFSDFHFLIYFFIYNFLIDNTDNIKNESGVLFLTLKHDIAHVNLSLFSSLN